ncbi:hypothetical protein JJB09_26290 [Rhizobium sp. KVB221]|uniref:Uncharacterized protein n=1 Tax=Rhizobium setariae TaxID=2801340 RepID=A0A936YUM2_9HYPH|nr:hypothetical protein [Rhizobium setariae]
MIADFQQGTDRIDISGITATPLRFIGEKAFPHKQGEFTRRCQGHSRRPHGTRCRLERR